MSSVTILMRSGPRFLIAPASVIMTVELLSDI